MVQFTVEQWAQRTDPPPRPPPKQTKLQNRQHWGYTQQPQLDQQGTNMKQGMQRSFLTPQEQFEQVELTAMPQDEADFYKKMKHARREFVFAGKQFVVYEMGRNAPKVLARFEVSDFDCNDSDGATTILRRTDKQEPELLVGYAPTRLWDFPVYIHLPIELKISFNAKFDDPSERSLAFGLVLRTWSRLNLREPRVTYCETRETFLQEFGELALD